jgi:REP element-mobilizing transposase RayT
MVYDKNKHNRHSIRLKHYDYSRCGVYYVTICTNSKGYMFGEIIDEKMFINSAGEMIEREYSNIPKQYCDTECDEYIIMPNHVHFMLQKENSNVQLSEIIRTFKSITTNEYIKGVKKFGWKRFEKRLWQRNYYEHIIRSDEEYFHAVEYIRNNPENWKKDKYSY